MRRTVLLTLAAAGAAAITTGSGLAGPGASGPAAMGSGQLSYVDPNEGEGYRTFSFSARGDANGNATGNAQVNNRAQDLKQTIDVDCLEVEGNRAWLGGVIRRSTVAQFEGRRVVFAVEDNGEGGSAPPDRLSFIFREGSDPMPSTDCRVFHPEPRRQVQNGNIQVRA